MNMIRNSILCRCLLAFAFAMLFGAVFACDTEELVKNDGEVCAGAVWGYVTDTEGEPLEGVAVTLRDGVGTEMETDDEGFFLIVGAVAGNEMDVQFKKKGYAKTHRPVNLYAGIVTSVEMKMKAVERSGARPADEDLDEELDDGTRVIIPTGALVDPDGNTATGDLDIEVTGLRVKTADVDAAPGNFRGEDIDGSDTKMESFGIIDLNFSKDGKELQLAAGQTALVAYPVDESEKEEGDVVPLWYYDTEKAKWIREGECVVEPNEAGDGLICVGEVAHFSTWNMDDPSSTTCVRGTLLDTNDKPVAGASVRSYGKMYAGTDQQYSREDGSFFILMQPGEKVDLYFFKGRYSEQRELDAPTTPYTDESSCKEIGEVRIDMDLEEQTPDEEESLNLCINVLDEAEKACGE